jgi:hypothetical protein
MLGSRWRIILPISVFVGLFMTIFQPFGLGELPGGVKALFLPGYGAITFLILAVDMVLIPAALPGLYREEQWTVGKEILNLTWILFSVGLGNLLYTSAWSAIPVSLETVLTFQGFTLAVGMIPISVLTILKHNYLHKRNRLAAEKLTFSISSSSRIPPAESPVPLQFSSDNGKENLKIYLGDLLFIRADGNYITVFFSRDKTVQSVLLRNTMLHAEELAAPYPALFKCHRSFLVNTGRITRVKGNSQGYRLLLEGLKDEIPVSRKNSGKLKEILNR